MKLKTVLSSKPFRLALIIMLTILGVIVLAVIIAPLLPSGRDWHDTFYPTAREVLAGHSPYNIVGFRYAPWAALPIIPFGFFSEQVGQAVFMLVSLLTLAFIAHRMKATPLTLGLFLISPPVMHGLLNCNIDWLTMLGFILPPQIGMFFVIIKPQVGAAVAVFWVFEAWRNDKWRGVFRLLWPVALATAASFLIFGFWPTRFLEPLGFWWNASLWPMSIPVGLTLLVAAIRTRKMGYAMAASPCLSPYVLFHSWAGAVLALITSMPEMVAAVAGLWILVAIRSVQMGVW